MIPSQVFVKPLPSSSDSTITANPDGGYVDINQIPTLKFNNNTTITCTLIPGYAITLDPTTNGTVSDAKIDTTTIPSNIHMTGNQIKTDVSEHIPVATLDAIKATATGRTFKGWSTSATTNTPPQKATVTDTTGNSVECYVFPGGKPDTLYAVWGPPYEIKYDYNGGGVTGSPDTTITKDTTGDGNYDFPDSPTYPQDTMAFDGWYTEKNSVDETTINGKKVTSSDKASAPTTLYAKWRGHEITLDATDGRIGSSEKLTLIADKTGKVDTTKIGTLSRTGYHFDHWSESREGPSIGNLADKVFSKNTTLYAVWEPDNPVGGGTTTTSATPQKAPAKPSVAMANGGTPVLTAEGDPEPEHTVTFDLQYTPAGATSSTLTTQKTDSNGQLTGLPAAPTRKGYEFKGWFLDADGTGDPVTGGANGTKFTGDRTVYAKWGPPYIIYFDLNDESGAELIEKTTDSKGTLDEWPTDPTRSGYEFKGWWTKNDGTGTKYLPTQAAFSESITLYAHWELTGHTITFHYNDDTGRYTTVPTNTAADKVGTVDFPTVARNGYYLVGWYSQAEGGAKYDETSIFLHDTELYAHWAKEVTLTLHHNNGTTKTTSYTTKNGVWKDAGTDISAKTLKDMLTYANIVYGGHEFVGWYDAPTDGTFHPDNMQLSKITSDTELYAHWEEHEFTITFVVEDDPNNPDTSYTPPTIKDQQTVNGKLTSFPDLERRPGYNFTGWYITEQTSERKVTLNEIYSANTTLTGKWEKVSTPSTPSGPTVTFYIDIPPMPTTDDGQSEVAHFTMVTNSSDKRLKQLPTLVGATKFNGWHEKGNDKPVTVSKVYNGDTNLYVSLSQTYQITLDWNNGDADKVSDKVFVYTGPDGKIAAADWPDPDTEGKRPERPGCYFDNWYTAATGGEVVPKSQTFTAPTVIYAHWKSPYTITFDANGGTFPDGEEKIETETDIAGSFERAKIPADP